MRPAMDSSSKFSTLKGCSAETACTSSTRSGPSKTKRTNPDLHARGRCQIDIHSRSIPDDLFPIGGMAMTTRTTFGALATLVLAGSVTLLAQTTPPTQTQTPTPTTSEAQLL